MEQPSAAVAELACTLLEKDGGVAISLFQQHYDGIHWDVPTIAVEATG